MTDIKYDSGTQKLLDDLNAKPQSFDRDEIIRRAKRFKYHDYKSDDAMCTMTLAKHLSAAGFKDLAENVVQGKYDQDAEESRKWREETPEGREMTRLAQEPEMQRLLNRAMGLAQQQKGRLEEQAREVIAEAAAKKTVKQD